MGVSSMVVGGSNVNDGMGTKSIVKSPMERMNKKSPMMIHSELSVPKAMDATNRANKRKMMEKRFNPCESLEADGINATVVAMSSP